MPHHPELLTSLAPLRERYDALLCDVWGVVHDGRAAFPAAVQALSAWRRAGGFVILVSNAPRPGSIIPGQLTRLGAPPESYDAVITSGDAIRDEIARRAPGPMLRIGPPAHDGLLWQDLDLQESEVEDAAFIMVSGLNDDLTEAPDDYKALLMRARARGLDLLCANPDIQVRVGDRLAWCAGALAQLYERLGGRVVMAGKPFAPIYLLAYERIAALRGAPVDKSRILAVGDGVLTDILGANAQGLDALFVAATGLHGDELMDAGRLDPARVAQALARERASARYAMAGLA